MGCTEREVVLLQASGACRVICIPQARVPACTLHSVTVHTQQSAVAMSARD